MPGRQRYYKHDEYSVENGPILLFLGGEWTITKATLANGLMHDIAQELNGTMYYLEHRFYGETHPTRSVYSAFGHALIASNCYQVCTLLIIFFFYTFNTTNQMVAQWTLKV